MLAHGNIYGIFEPPDSRLGLSVKAGRGWRRAISLASFFARGRGISLIMPACHRRHLGIDYLFSCSPSYAAYIELGTIEERAMISEKLSSGPRNIVVPRNESLPGELGSRRAGYQTVIIRRFASRSVFSRRESRAEAIASASSGLIFARYLYLRDAGAPHTETRTHICISRQEFL